MRIKVLIPPFLIVMTLILTVGFVKPDLDVLKTKKTEIGVKDDNVKNMTAIIQNIGSLNSSLDKEPDFEKLIYRYLPGTLNQEQVIDAFNFMATQSGVVITKMDLKDSLPQRVAPDDGNGNASGDAQLSLLSDMKTFVFTGSIIGSYENIKIFFDRLSHMERFQKISSFSVASDSSTRPVDTSHLTGTFETAFGYLPPAPIQSALDVPIFRSSIFDFSNKNKLLEQATSTIPVLDKGNPGRPNPFQ